MQGIFYPCNMEATIVKLKHQLAKLLPQSQVKVEEPERAGGGLLG